MNEALHQYAKIDPQADFEIQQHMSQIQDGKVDTLTLTHPVYFRTEELDLVRFYLRQCHPVAKNTVFINVVYTKAMF